MKLSLRLVSNLRRGLLGCAIAATVLAGAIVAENIRGNRAWRRLQAEYAAHGESLEVGHFVRVNVPDDQNLFKAPIWTTWVYLESSKLLQGSSKEPEVVSKILNLTTPGSSPLDLSQIRKAMTRAALVPDHQGNDNAEAVLAGMHDLAPLLNGLRHAAAERPLGAASRPPMYNELNLGAIYHTAQLITFRSQVELAAGESAEAYQDLITALRIARACETHPATLLQIMIAAEIADHSCETVKMACSSHAWTDEQLISAQEAFANLNLVTEVESSLRLERAWTLQIIDQFPTLSKKEKTYINWLSMIIPGWVQQNKVALCRTSELAITAIAAFGTPDYPRMYEELQEVDRQLMKSWSPTTHIARLSRIDPARTAGAFARHRDVLSATEIAIALERYYREHGHYPPSIQTLKPMYLMTEPVLSDATSIGYIPSSDLKAFVLQGESHDSSGEKVRLWEPVAVIK